MMSHYITILHFAQGALVGGGIAPASDPLLSVLRRGNSVLAGGSVEVAWGDGIGGGPEFVATADLLSQGTAASAPTWFDLFVHGAAMPVPGFGIPVGLLAHGAVVPTLVLGALGALFAQGAAVPTPGFGMLVGLFAHGAFVPS